jgi:hypothetical protein
MLLRRHDIAGTGNTLSEPLFQLPVGKVMQKSFLLISALYPLDFEIPNLSCSVL